MVFEHFVAAGYHEPLNAMIYEYDLKEILPRLHGPLRELLDAEIAAGNEMIEISDSWPLPNVNVWLKRPITQKYTNKYPQLKYSYLGDPKNWLEEYVDLEIGAMVAAKC